MQTKSPILKPMRTTLIVIAMLVSMTSVRAQGFINTGGIIEGDVNDIAPIDFSFSSPASPSQGLSLLSSSPNFQTQVSSFTIQAVPEPSPLALGSLALGLMAALRFFRKTRPVSTT
jgi:hypothetical protein